MKQKIVVLATCLLMSLAISQNSWAQLGLVGDWPFEEGAGTDVYDMSSQGHDGVFVGSPVRIIGQFGEALEFDGFDDFVNINQVANLDVSSGFTIMLWVRPNRVDTHQVLISRDQMYEVEISHINLRKYSVRIGNLRAGEGNTSVQAGVWQHLTVSWDGSSTVRYYYNGQPDGSMFFTGSFTPLTGNLLGLGARGIHTPYCDGFFLCGALDEVEIHDEVLTDAEVLAEFQATATDLTVPQLSNSAPAQILPGGTVQTPVSLTTDEAATCRFDTVPGTLFKHMPFNFSGSGTTSHSALVTGLADEQIYSYYVRCQDAVGNTTTTDYEIRFAISSQVDLALDLLTWLRANEGSGCQALDSSGKAAHGDLGPNCDANSPLWVPGLAGSALDFDGTDDEVVVSTSALGSPLSAVSFSAWMKVPSAGGYRSIFDRRNAGTDGYDLYLEPAGRLFLRVNDATLTGQASVADDTWHHVAGVYDGNKMTLYVDGKVDATLTVGSKTLGTTADLYLGHHFSVDSYTLSGSLDGMRMYDRALSDIEILALYLSAP